MAVSRKVSDVKAALFSSSDAVLKTCDSLHVNTLKMQTLYSSKEYDAALNLSRKMLRQIKEIVQIDGETVENMRLIIGLRMLRAGIFKAKSDLNAVLKETGLILNALNNIPDAQKTNKEFLCYEKCIELLTLPSEPAPTFTKN